MRNGRQNGSVAIADRNIHVDGMQLRATVSAGVSYGTEWGEPFESMRSAADAALYDAKRGRSQRVKSPFR